MKLNRFLCALTCAVAAAACGGSSSPTSPSPAPGANAAAPTASTAVIAGTVLGTASSRVSATSGHAITGLTVTVVGTDLSATIDVAGRFALGGVPPGDVQLRFSGGTVESTVPVAQVQPLQTITLTVVVSGTTVAVDVESRSGAGDDELEARIESLPPTVAAGSFVAGGRTVTTDGSTRIEQGGSVRSFADLAIGQRVHVKGRSSGGQLLASQVQIQNTDTTIPVEINGAIDAVAGTPAAFQFNIGSRLIKGDASTTFFGDGDVALTFTALVEGARVEVKGSQRDGYVYATRIHVNGAGGDGTGDTSASIAGALTALSGTRPTLLLTVAGTTVHTTGATEVKRRGDVQSLDALQIGQTLHVVGTREADGSLIARKIEIDGDAPGGEFEIEGAMGGLSGTCPAIAFGINGFSIRTSASTTFEGGPCAALKSGTKVQVKGTRGADGVVTAASVTTK